MKKLILVIPFALLLFFSNAQYTNLDSLNKALVQAKSDSEKFYTLSFITFYYTFSKPDSAMMYARQGIALARKMKSEKSLSAAYAAYGAVLSQMGNYPQAIYFELEALKIVEKLNDYLALAWRYSILASTYTDAGDYEHALFYTLKEQSFSELYHNSSNDTTIAYYKDLYNDVLFGFTSIYEKLNQPDSALKYIRMVTNQDVDPTFWLSGNTYFKKGDYLRAISSYQSGYKWSINRHFYANVMSNCNGLAKTFRKINMTDSCIFYANKVLEYNNYARYPVALLEALDLLADVYKSKGNSDSTVKYLQLTLSIKDSLFNQRKIMQMQSITFSEQLRQQDILDAQKAYENRIKTYLLIGGLIALLLIAAILFKSNRQKQIANKKIEKAYQELKSTQAQLIQSEKMASLGQLTAGIAHEIQNPLNFVNNFSEVNNELIEELRSQKSKVKSEEEDEILNDIFQNNEKISYHGKRADAIVKGMMQHSHTNTGKKEPTDINALADEYVRLAYQGLRAKDKDFNVTIQTDFDKNVEQIEVVPQDIGRVLLNLYNNAFYAVAEKKKSLNGTFEPIVSVSTRKLNDRVEIIVKDNGNGIPEKVKNKIYQPFFTTKPTGEGTGLGLSLSYDIIKAHGGEIKVNSKEGEGSEFIISLPEVNSGP